MVLESQNAGVGGNRIYSRTRGRRRSPRPVLWLVLIAVGIGLAVWLWPDGGGEEGSDEPGADQATINMPADPRATVDRPAGRESTPRFERASPPSPPPGRESAGAAGTDASEAEQPPRRTSTPETEPVDETPTVTGSAGTDPQVTKLITAGEQLLDNDQVVRGRELLNQALQGPIGAAEAAEVRRILSEVNARLVFSPAVAEGDPLAEAYVVQPGDVLSNIAPKFEVPWRFLSRINNDLEPRRLQIGQRLKVVRGPFHMVVHKDAFRADLYLQDMYVRSFDVGLGAHGSTPLGSFIVKKHSKLTNPEWVNPRTGERYNAEDPENPLGERWIGLRGTDENTELLRGYGLHGTIEPESIGTQASMGCIRFLPDDIAMIFDLMSEEKSRVMIVR